MTFFIAFNLGVSQEQNKVFLTVYNQDLGLVREVRNLDFKKGVFEIKFRDVASGIDPTSVHFKVLNFPDKVSILEQNYQFDLVSSDKILEKYLDKTIQLVSKQGVEYKGELLAFDSGNLTLKDQGGAIRIVSRGEIRDIFFPALPEGLITRPTLVWLLDSEIAGKQAAEVSYLTSGINWHAEYVAVVDKEDKNLELAGWVSIDNRSGATYEDAKLKLIAGDVHRVREELRRQGYVDMMPLAAAREAVPFEEKAFFEYHLYTLTRPATVKDKEIKQITLFSATQVKVQKIFTYDGSRDNKKVKVNLEFMNSEKEGLGLPLPKGKVRVYKEDVDKSQEFIGEDLIDHTPKDEKVRIYVGNAFDIVGERIQTDYKKISEDVQRYSFEITLRNHKEETVEVVVIEHLYGGEWEIINSNFDYIKKDAYTIEFKIPLEKNSEKKLNYTVQYVR